MSGSVRALWIAAALAATLATASPAKAQDNAGNGFLFHTPSATFTFTGGYALATTGSDVFSFARQQLTLGNRAFDAINFGAELAFRITPRTDVVLSSSYAGTRKPSEFRDWLDNNDLPIQQSSGLARWPVTIGAKYYVLERGRSLGQFAWVPARYSAFVGAGVGAMWYRFDQDGDFVDYETEKIFTDHFKSEGWTPTGYVSGGVDYTLNPTWSLTTEMRYTQASGDPSKSFVGFKRIDLSGLTASAGFTIRF